MATIVDNVVDELSISHLLAQFEGSALQETERTSLPFIHVPCKLDQRIREILKAQTSSHPDSANSAQPQQLCFGPQDDGTVVMPGRVARGSSHMHTDTGFDENDTPVDVKLNGLVCVLYLRGDGQLVIDDGSDEEQEILVMSGRLVLWPNKSCVHRLDAGNDTRTMIGPMSLSCNGEWIRAGDQYAVAAGPDAVAGVQAQIDENLRRSAAARANGEESPRAKSYREYVEKRDRERSAIYALASPEAREELARKREAAKQLHQDAGGLAQRAAEERSKKGITEEWSWNEEKEKMAMEESKKSYGMPAPKKVADLLNQAFFPEHIEAAEVKAYYAAAKAAAAGVYMGSTVAAAEASC